MSNTTATSGNIGQKEKSKEYLSVEELSLRDYFAARMMVYHLAQETTPHRKYNYMNAAIGAYEMADAMLEVRKK